MQPLTPHLGQRVHPDQGLHVRDYNSLSAFACADSRSAKIPDDAVSTLQSNDKITVEHDGEVKTQ
jgi:hypothetical protein